jgi:glucan-binding YG repeat protein
MSLVQLIKDRLTEAIIKVSGENPALNREGEPTAEEARDMFIASLMAELFPEHGNEAAAVVVVPVVEPEPVVVPAKKLTKEEKAAEKAAKEAAKAEAKAAKEAEKAAKEAAKAAKEAAKEAKVKSPKKSPEEKAAEKEAAKAAKEAEKAAAKAAKEAEKEAAKAAKEAEKEAAKAAKEAEKEAKKAAKVALPASPKPVGNIPKIDPTWRKLLKEADKEHAKELEPELLKYLNSMDNAAFNDKPARQHVADFIATRQPVAEPVEPAGPVDLEVVEFNGQDYYVNPETKRVYEGVMSEDGELKITRPVGYVGMADFKDMVLDDE